MLFFNLRLANKQDHMEALDEVDVADKLHLESLANQCQTPTRIGKRREKKRGLLAAGRELILFYIHYCFPPTQTEVCSATVGTGKSIDPIIRIGFQ
jgi:hypothetical protein